ncbi:unnamed protein product [Caenorhabditis brenneri]
MPIIFKTNKKPPVKKEPPEKTLCDHGTQTKLCLTRKETPKHQDYPVILYPRFWEVLALATTFSTHGRIGFNCSTAKETDDHDYVVSQAILKYVFGLELIGYTVPMTAVSMSIAAENFVTGKTCFDFPPEDSKYLLVDSEGQVPFFTYQLITDRIQATYFNYKGLAYLAGITFLLRLKTDEAKEVEDMSAAQKAFEHTWLQRRHFPDENVTHQRRFYGKDCQRLRKRVLVSFNKHHGKVVHMMFNNASKEFWMDFCSKCDTMEMTPSTYFAEKLHIPTFYPIGPNDPDQVGVVQTAVMKMAKKTKKDASFHISLTKNSAGFQLHLGAPLPSSAVESPKLTFRTMTSDRVSDVTNETGSRASSSVGTRENGYLGEFLEPDYASPVWQLPSEDEEEDEDKEVVDTLNVQEDQPKVGSLSDEDLLQFVKAASKITLTHNNEFVVDLSRRALQEVAASIGESSQRSVSVNTEVSVNLATAQHLEQIGRQIQMFAMYNHTIPSEGTVTRAISLDMLSEFEMVSDTGADHGSDIEEEEPAVEEQA